MLDFKKFKQHRIKKIKSPPSCREAIRKQCLMVCKGNRYKEVELCTNRDCSLLPYRSGKTLKGVSDMRLRGIKLYCLSCRNNELAVKDCKQYSCWLWSFRTGSRPESMGGLSREQYVSLFNFHTNYKAGEISETEYLNKRTEFFKESDIFNEAEFIQKRKDLIRMRADMLGLPDPVYPGSNLYADRVTETKNQIIFHDVLPVNYDVVASGREPVCHITKREVIESEQIGFEPLQ